MFTIPPTNYKTRLIIIVTGITVLLWSGLEDNNAVAVSLLGWVVATLSVVIFIMSNMGGQHFTQTSLLKISPLIGAIIGAAATLVTVLLMLFKNVRHAHVFPDYPPQMMLDTLTRLPFWAVSGSFLLFGIILFWTMRPIESDDKGDIKSTD